MLLLFLRAVVFTLAEEPVEDEAVQEYLDEEGDETITERAGEENYPVVVQVQVVVLQEGW